jgi:hypothetical protein
MSFIEQHQKSSPLIIQLTTVRGLKRVKVITDQYWENHAICKVFSKLGHYTFDPFQTSHGSANSDLECLVSFNQSKKILRGCSKALRGRLFILRTTCGMVLERSSCIVQSMDVWSRSWQSDALRNLARAFADLPSSTGKRAFQDE